MAGSLGCAAGVHRDIAAADDQDIVLQPIS